MSLLNKLQAGDAANQSFNGNTPAPSSFSTSTSPLPNTYSINGNPIINDFQSVGGPSPSQLDLNGQTPSQYINNLPG